GLPSTKALYAGKRGDICRFLSSGSGGIGVVSDSYRLPTLDELLYGKIKGTSDITISILNWTSAILHGNWTRIGSISNPNDWSNISSTPTDATGQYTYLKSGGNYSGYATFPASGYRFGDNGGLIVVGAGGLYLNGSANAGTTTSFRLTFSSTGVIPGSFTPRADACSVRCVLEE
ncbi:MAG: hypothetical protein LBS46_06690, partial [Dysgonamonadaceae bacterium]|nr:hypothetical protein [Dysgonamonadaceae bacterium]